MRRMSFALTEPTREGFIRSTMVEFIEHFCKSMKCKPSTVVNTHRVPLSRRGASVNDLQTYDELTPHDYIECTAPHLVLREPHCAECDRGPDHPIHGAGENAPEVTAA